jgi:hypothetical protein
VTERGWLKGGAGQALTGRGGVLFFADDDDDRSWWLLVQILGYAWVEVHWEARPRRRGCCSFLWVTSFAL